MNIPTELTAGDSYTWKDSETVDNLGNSITSSSWTLYYALRGASSLTLTATADGPGWQTSITTAQSTALTAGDYFWQAYVTSGSNRITLGDGKITIKTNIAAVTAANFDGRSQAKQDLDAVQAAIRAIIAGGAVQEYSIGNRSLTKMKITELLELESKLKADVVREEKKDKIAQGLGNPSNLFVRFKK
jgi:hypothetical protein